MAFLVAGTEEACGRIPQVAVVIEVTQEDFFVVFIATLPRNLIGTPIIVGILERLRHTAVRQGERHIAEGEVFVPALAAIGSAIRPFVENFMGVCL